MNKTDLVNALADKMGIPQCKSRQFLNAFQDVLTKRSGRNPRTGVPCVIEARTSVKFKPGKFLLEALNPQNK